MDQNFKITSVGPSSVAHWTANGSPAGQSKISFTFFGDGFMYIWTQCYREAGKWALLPSFPSDVGSFFIFIFFPTTNFLKRQREVCESGRTSTHGWPTLAFPSSKPQSIISYPSCPADPVLQTTNQMFSSYKCLKLMIR